MNHQSGPQFRLEPSGFRRHDITGIGNIQQLFHGYRIQSESNLHFTAVHAFFQFTQPTDTSYEIDSFRGT